MSDKAKQGESRDSATNGGRLTREERDALEAVYTERGEADRPVLRETADGVGSYSVRTAGLSAADRQVAATLKRHVAEIGRPVEFRVFGSRARGDATGESDLDVFIELEMASPATRRRIDDLAWEIGFAAGMVISPLVVTRDELETGPVGANPIIQRIMAEGVAV
jgi:uncharacterized protein